MRKNSQARQREKRRPSEEMGQDPQLMEVIAPLEIPAPQLHKLMSPDL